MGKSWNQFIFINSFIYWIKIYFIFDNFTKIKLLLLSLFSVLLILAKVIHLNQQAFQIIHHNNFSIKLPCSVSLSLYEAKKWLVSITTYFLNCSKEALNHLFWNIISKIFGHEFKTMCASPSSFTVCTSFISQKSSGVETKSSSSSKTEIYTRDNPF